MGANGSDTGEGKKGYLWDLLKKFRKPDEEEIPEAAGLAPQEAIAPEAAIVPEESVSPQEAMEPEEAMAPETQPESSESAPPQEEQAEEWEPQEEASALEFELPPEEEDDPEGPASATVKVLLDALRMEATLVVSPPEEGGRHVSIGQLRQALKAVGVCFGISEAMLSTVARLRLYNKPCVVAKGKPAVDGVNGRVENHFSQKVEAHPNDRGDGTVDYKDLRLIRDIPQGTVIADIIPPTPMQPGTNIQGKRLNGREGRTASVRIGRGTALSKDGSQLLAAQSGNLVWKKDRFEVEETLHIAGSIDNTIGNIVFSGDVVVGGDVCEGYSIHGGRNVTVHGFVEGATIIAKGDVVIKKGMNGMGKGSIEAGGNVNCRFFENSDVYCAGTVEAESILNSTISSEDKIILRGRRGAIMGGACSACNLIEARSIGTDSQVVTHIHLGASSKVMEKQKRLQEELKEAERYVDMMEKDVSYLTALADAGKLSTERQKLLSQRNIDRTKALEQLENICAELRKLEEAIDGARAGRLVAMTLHPPVHLTMSGLRQIIQTEERNVSYYVREGEIKRGTVV